MTLAEELKSRNFSKSINEASYRKRSFADSFTLQVYTDNGQCNVFFPTLYSLLEAKLQVGGDDVCVNGTCCTSRFGVHSWGEWHPLVGRPARRSILLEQRTALSGNSSMKIYSEYWELKLTVGRIGVICILLCLAVGISNLFHVSIIILFGILCM